MIKKGKITSWNDEKGFGFITPVSGEGQIFAHIKAFKCQDRRPEVNRSVTYILSTDKQDRICAAEVTMSAAPVVDKTGQCNWVLNAYAVLFLALMASFCMLGIVSYWLMLVYLAMSSMAYLFYFIDKSAAQSGGWRTPESTLHLLELFCGWPGALLAQQWLRHKTIKKSFQITFRLNIVVNSCVCLALINPSCRESLKYLIIK